MAPDYAVNSDRARAVLKKAWDEIGSKSRPPTKMQEHIDEVLNASDVTYKYILATGYLGKCVNPDVHARALQKGSSLKGAYDARSLAHGVLVGFEKSKGNLFGLSNEPFVNKPARHPEHDKANDQLRNKVIAAATHDALEQAQQRSKREVFQGLVHILRVGAKNAANEKQVEVTTSANQQTVISFVEEFLTEADGGARLVAVWGAFTALLSKEADVKAHSPNMADRYAKTSGDVEVKYNRDLVSASECKQRPLNLDDVKHGIKKATDNGVPEYLFVVSHGVVANDKDEILRVIRKTKGIDVALIDIHHEAPRYALMLNPARRAKFGLQVVRLLRDMRKFESANAAADLWKKVTPQKDSASKSE
jgi:hypothetical protein